MGMPAEEQGRPPEAKGRGRLKRLLVAGLGALVLVQVALIAHEPESLNGEAARPALRFIEVGDTLWVDSLTSERAPHLFGSRGATGSNLVILTFSSSCSHSRAVALKWRDWLREDRDLRVVAVTSDPEDSARAYSQKEGWNVQVISLAGLPRASLGVALTRLTPAVYLTDADGVVRYTGHGARLDALDEAIAALFAGRMVEGSFSPP
jgi:hypothetical protein